MPTRTLGGGICAALMTTGISGLAPATYAADLAPSAAAGCVTNAEYDAVHRGMLRPRVHRIFGTPGVVNGGGPGVEIRTYDRCRAAGGMVNVTFEEGNDGAWRLARKTLFDA